MRSIFAASRQVASLVIILALLATPVAALSAKGQKNFKRGLEHEAAQRWEQAAEEFALAMAADPSNAEYQLHYRRSIFNASQLFMQQGSAHAERGDYVGAYNAFRRAHGYDPSNDLARSMMERMERLQLQKDEGAAPADKGTAAAVKISQTGFAHDAAPAPSLKHDAADDAAPAAPRAEQLRVITYNGDLEDFIKYLARELRLNVVFDRDFPKRAVELDLHDVTAAQALDYLFLTQGLFFQKLSARTILVADQQKRPQYQQLVLRTFYLSNVDPNEAKQLIQAAMPPQTGRQPVITANKTTNSITVRDTPENVRLVSELLKSIDKERAEVVMDVNIYEVSRADLMQFGNQFGGEGSLRNLGGIQKGLTIFGGSRDIVTSAISAPTALGAALVVPASSLNALQRKDTTRLIASTQVHAFDGEKSTAHIGQRVPVQTATVTPFGSAATGEGQNPQAAVAPGLFGGNGYPVIQYEKTGLTLEFTPQVAPNLDVQVKMLIKSNDVAQTDGAALTPTFTERNIEGTARIQNNRTMMIASVAQNQQSRGRQGLPVLGLVPVLGRLFTAPRRNDSQTDIVIAVTPHVLRAPAITPHDEEARPSGTLQTPNSDTLEAMLQEVRREEQLAAARMIPRHTVTHLPDAEHAAFMPAPKALMNSVAARGETNAPSRNAVLSDAGETVDGKAAAESRTKPVVGAVESGAPRVRPSRRVTNAEASRPLAPRAGTYEVSAAELKLSSDAQPLRAGERRQVRLLLKTDAPLGLVAA
ncbi:MAG TPA: secretin N-terminal domain-containing protein, partial [Pyrinomonadaceae bacterium]|nr:secretin N-terminal domain-containing protein [Pyrinomonadaceae bacterium]